tara:strand:- start:154 stop:363 length:210 start_codon:yes stop_codon:yes gene_type:complete
MAFKMKYKSVDEVIKALKKAVKAHSGQADFLENMKKNKPHTTFNAGLRAAEKAGKLPEEFAKKVRASSK